MSPSGGQPRNSRRFVAILLGAGLVVAALAIGLRHKPVPPTPPAPGAGQTFDADYGLTNRTTQAIQAVVAQRQQAVQTKDRAAFLETVDAADPTYLVEQGHWFDDSVRTVTHYELSLHGLQVLDRSTAQARLSESFTLQSGERRTRDYTAVYRLRPGGWKDDDYVYTQLHQDHVTVKHWDLPRAGSLALTAEAANVAWLQKTFQWRPAADVVIKLYPDRTLFLYSIKPSLPTWVAGWTEAGESIKYWVTDDAPPDEGLLHETTHHMLSEMTNDNAAYWLQEGLATWTPRAREKDFGLTHERQVLGGDHLRWTLPQLEAINLETLTKDVSSYYAESYLVVRYLIDEYGMDRFQAVAAQLAKHPANPVTAAEKLHQTDALTRQAIESALGIPFDQFAAQWQTWAEAQLRSSP